MAQPAPAGMAPTTGLDAVRALFVPGMRAGNLTPAIEADVEEHAPAGPIVVTPRAIARHAMERAASISSSSFQQ